MGAEIPSITYALRGLAYFEVRLQGPASDLHSGIFGGAVVNPANALAKLIGGLHDEQGRVTLPGFYDDVKPLSEAERAELAELPQSEEWWSRQSGAELLAGEHGFSSTERATARPTLDVNGLLSGFTGKGSKTVLPAQAMAKISCRLVADQDPGKIHGSLLAYMDAHAPPGVTWEVDALAGAIPAIIDRDSREVAAAKQALEEVWGTSARFKREGGTVPVVAMIEELLNVQTLMLGFGLPNDNLHAPNERFYIPNYNRGIDTFIRFTFGLAS
jgi:acetylornithine deacetylase/succinyl-diaminopimelate desuccinylase-like protein